MGKNKEKEELQTRREFFKKAAKSALPIVAGMILSSMPQVASAASRIAMGCELGCHGGCERGCKETCKGSCEGGCNASCSASCYRTCKGGCQGTCRGCCTGRNEADLEE